MRYVERNPVRASLAAVAADYAWSSAAAHCGLGATLIDLTGLPQGWSAGEWAAYVGEDADVEVEEIRRATHTGRPVGSPQFTTDLEIRLARSLVPSPGGRPRKKAAGTPRERWLF